MDLYSFHSLPDRDPREYFAGSFHFVSPFLCTRSISPLLLNLDSHDQQTPMKVNDIIVPFRLPSGVTPMTANNETPNINKLIKSPY